MINNFPQYIHAKDKTVMVMGYIETVTLNESKDWIDIINKDKYIDGKGYIYVDGSIWIYSKDGKPYNTSGYPYFWINETKTEFEDGGKIEKAEVCFSHPDEELAKYFREEHLVDLSMKLIVDNTSEDEELYNEQAINDMNAAAAIFVPNIKDEDDFLKKLIKNAIIEKHIDISRLKYRMTEKYSLPNMKAALQSKTKMSVLYFLSWCELLGLDFTIMVEDNGTDPQDPLKERLYYVSRKDQVLKEKEL